MTLYAAVWYFMIYSFLGWVLEVVYHAVGQGLVVNRGFLNGPVCPIYGVGVILIFTLAELFYEGGVEATQTIVLFAGGVVFATAVELFGGWALDKLFHARWWDYSNEPFNLHGYICLKFSLLWGLAIVFVVRVLHPFIAAHSAAMIPEKYGWPVLAVLGAAYLADIIVTVAIIIGLNKRITELDDMRANMRTVSDNLSEVLGKGGLMTAQRIENGQVQAALAKAELAEKMEAGRAEAAGRIEKVRADAQQRRDARAEALEAQLDRAEATVGVWFEKQSKMRTYIMKRIIKAFPDFALHEHEETLAELKQYIEEHWNGPRD
jgi:uncharacterized membrane protein